MTSPTPVHHLRSAGVSVLVDLTDDLPAIRYWGTDLGDLTAEQLRAVVTGATGALANSVGDVKLPPGLLPAPARAFRGRPGLAGHRDGATPPVLLTLSHCTATDGGRGLRIEQADPGAGLTVTTQLVLDAHGVLTLQHHLDNTGDGDYHLAELGLALPVPAAAREIADFTGTWAGEKMPQRVPFGFGAWTRENRRGRTGFDSAFLMAVGTPGFRHRSGEVWALHLGWSGNHAHWAEASPDGSRLVGAAELLSPGEIRLAPGERYSTPVAYAAHSTAGTDGIADRFHRMLRARPQHPSSPRPVVLNTWEAVYFDHDLAVLTGLAETAAAIGVERFVLDDGWFGGRRDDTSSLGDWTESADVWPDGLGPLVDRVHELGMQFGLWFEPEMVNPDSELHRAHPDWVLADPDRVPATARHQLVLDLARPEVSDHLFERISALVERYRIAFIKWDHNRDLVAAQHDGRPGVHAQTTAVYALLDRLRAAHPELEIESCSSGGARVDLGILQRTDRVWGSDSNDALARQQIQQGTLLVLPPELIGAHVGPPHTHTTGRTHDLSFRVATALFGHFGMEWDIASASEQDRAGLTAAIALYRRLRGLLHSGTVVNADVADPAVRLVGVVSQDRSHAVFSYAQLAQSRFEAPPPATFPGLDPDRSYRVELLEPAGAARTWQRGVAPWLAGADFVLPGAALATTGLGIPAIVPEQAVLLELTAV